MNLAKVIYKLKTDKDFVLEFRSDPEETLLKHGYELTNDEIQKLQDRFSQLKINSDGTTVMAVDNSDWWGWAF